MHKNEVEPWLVNGFETEILGPVPRFNLVFMHLDFWDPDPGTRDPDCGLAPEIQQKN